MDSKEATLNQLPESETTSDNGKYNSFSDVKDGVSDDEGYVSGEEEFETPTDKPVVFGIGDEIFGNSDAPFVDAPATVESLPGSEVVVDNDDDVEKDVVVEDSAAGVAAVDGNVGDSVVEEVETKGNESENIGSLNSGDEGSEPVVKDKAPIVDPEADLLDNKGDVKLTSEGDSVVDTIQVDLAEQGVVVVGEPEENVEVENNQEARDVAEPGVVELKQLVVSDPVEVSEPEVKDEATIVELEETELVDHVGDSVIQEEETKANESEKIQIGSSNGEDEVREPEVKDEAVEQEESGLLDNKGDVKLTSEGDSVVDTIQVDVARPGGVVVSESEENVDLVNNQEAKDVAEAGVVEPEQLEVSNPNDARLTPEGDHIVDTIQVDAVAPGVAVVGELEENEGDKLGGGEVPIESIGSTVESSDIVDEAASSREAVVKSQKFESLGEKVLEHDSGNGELESGAVSNSVNGAHMTRTTADSVDRGGTVDVEELKKPGAEYEPAVAHKAFENGGTFKIDADGEVGLDHSGVNGDNDESADEVSEMSRWIASDESKAQEIAEIEDGRVEEVGEDSDDDTDGLVFSRSSGAAEKYVVSESEEEGDTDDEGDGKELFDSAALAALLKAATGADSDGGNITITSQDGSRLFSVERPAGLGSSLRSLRPAPGPNRTNLFNNLPLSGAGESEENLSEDEKRKLEKLQQIRVKFLRLVQRLGLSPEESVAAQVLYRLALLGGRQGTQSFSLDAAKQMASQLELEKKDDLDFSINILVLGKSGVGKSATINSILGDEKACIDAFENGTASTKVISGSVDGVKIQVVDTPSLRTSAMEQAFNRGVLSSVQKVTKKSPPDVVLYVDRLDAQTRDLNDLPLLKTVTSALGPSIWRSAIVTLTHSASAPPDGPSGTPLSYEVFVSQRSHVVQQSIGHAVGDLRMMSPSLMNPVSLVENHRDCRKNREGQKILPNGQSWRPQLLLLCFSMKILSEASSLLKPQDPFDHRKLFGFRARSPPLPYMLSSMLQSRAHPKLPSDQGGDSVDSDIELDDFSDSDQEEEEDEYDQLPPFKPLRKAQIAKLSKEQRKAYIDEYDYRVKLLQKKQWKEELRRMRELKKKGKGAINDYGFAEDEADSGAAAPIAVPLPDMALPPSFDSDNPAYRYRFLEPTSQFLARPVLDTHGWDHDCGYDGVNLEHSLAIINRFPVAYTVQITKDKKDFTVSLDSSVSVKHGDQISSMAGFDIQSMGKQLAYIVRGETKFKNLKKHKAAGGVSFTFLGENVVPGVKIEDQITLGKQYVLVGSAGAVKSQQDTAYGANFELQRRELDYPIGQVQSTISISLVKWRGDLALGLNSLAQFSMGRNSKVAVRAGINNKMSGQVTVKTSSSEHLSLALAAIVPAALSVYKKLWPTPNEKYSIY